MEYIRPLISILKKRLENEPRRFIQVIYGPRQVGKTTLVQQFLKQTALPYHYASADAVMAADSVWISQQWEAARIACMKATDNKAVLVIDEIQKIENWSEWVKKEWDSDSAAGLELYVILLGSSRLLLQQGHTESLAGRYESTYAGHWSYSEMKEAFGFTPEHFVWFGGYPGSVPLMEDEMRWKQYIRDSLIETTVSKDILMLTRVDKPALMKRLFELGCHYSGQTLSYNKLLGQLLDAGNTTTLSHYVNLLDSAGLLAGLEKFTPNQIRQRSSSPKFQVYNTALISAQHSMNYEEIRNQPDAWGRLVTSAVGAHLLNHSRGGRFKLMYWRHGNDEVDFVMEKDGQVFGLEIKSGSARRRSGMQAFSKQHQPHKMLLIGNSGLPWQEFLQINPETL